MRVQKMHTQMQQTCCCNTAAHTPAARAAADAKSSTIAVVHVSLLQQVLHPQYIYGCGGGAPNCDGLEGVLQKPCGCRIDLNSTQIVV